MSPDERERYSRQIRYSAIGEAGQEKICCASVAVVGCGALGSFQAEALVRAGIGRIRLIDRDYVDYTNLQRQWLYEETDAENETPKAIAAAQRLRRLNRHVQVEPLVKDATPSNVEELLADCDLILDGTDNFETRYLLNDLSVSRGIPWIYGAAIGSYGVVLPVWPGKGPCLACVFPERPAGSQMTCEVNGILASATASVAALQVSIGMHLLVGWENYECRVHTFDVWEGTARQVNAGEPDPECPVCARREFSYLEGGRRTPVSLCGRNAVQIHQHSKPIDLQQLAAKLQTLGRVRVNEFAMRLALPKYELTVFPDGRAIVKGTTDIALARSVYAQFVGN